MHQLQAKKRLLPPKVKISKVFRSPIKKLISLKRNLRGQRLERIPNLSWLDLLKELIG